MKLREELKEILPHERNCFGIKTLVVNGFKIGIEIPDTSIVTPWPVVERVVLILRF